MAKEQRTIVFSGDVQGVGFRYTACRVAARYEIGGYVRNLRDGRVEVLAEGKEAEVDAFVAELSEAMRGYIRQQTQTKGPCSGAYGRFDVRF